MYISIDTRHVYIMIHRVRCVIEGSNARPREFSILAPSISFFFLFSFANDVDEKFNLPEREAVRACKIARL